MKDHTINNLIIKSIGAKKVTSFRIHAEMQNGKIGLTAWYTSAVIEDIKQDVKDEGHKIIKVEEK